MPLAKQYSSSSPAQNNTDVGPSPYEQMGKAFGNFATDPQVKVIRYTVTPTIRGLPVVGRAYRALEWFTDPMGELKKELNISPTIGGSIGEAIVSNLVLWPGRVLVAGVGAASAGQISSSLVQNAMAYEWANQAVAAKRNFVKWSVSQVWNGLVKGDWLFDNLIYDKVYLFHKAADEAGERFAKWDNNNIVESFNSRGRKYGIELSGDELKLGSHAFSVCRMDRGGGWESVQDPKTGQILWQHNGKSAGWVPMAKGFKMVWQTAAPIAATSLIFPPLAPAVAAWQLINIDWQQFVSKSPLREEAWRRNKDGSFSNPIDEDIREFGEHRGKVDSAGRYMKGGKFKEDWSRMSGADKFFQTMSDFTTLRGWYRTFVTGESLRSRAFTNYTVRDPQLFNLKMVSFGKDAAGRDVVFKNALFKKNPGHAGWKHVGWHKGTNSKIYEKVVKLSSGEMIVKMYRDKSGVWKFSNNITRGDAISRFWQGAYNVQQFGKTIVSRFGAPVALAVILPNPVTYAFAAYSAFKGVGEVLEPLKFVGWSVKEMNQVQMIKAFAGKYGGKALGGLSLPFALVLRENGNSFFRRAFRRVYSLLNPFDRDVGILRGILEWRDAQWAKFLSEHTRIGKVLELAERIPFAGALFRTGGFLVGGIKWVVAPGQAIKDKVVQFIGWTVSKGIRWALGKAFRSWVSRPLVNWLQNQIIKLPAGSLRRRLFEAWLRRIAGHIPLPKLPSSFFGRVFSPIFNALKAVLKQIISKIIELIKRLLIELVKAVINIVLQGVKTVMDIFGITTLPAWGTVALVGLAILAVLLILALILVVIFLAVLFVASLGNVSSQSAPPINDVLEIRKEVANPKSNGALFAPNETIEYSIKYKIKKKVKDPIKFEDKFLVGASDSSGTKLYFKAETLKCNAPAQIDSVSLDPDPGGPAGTWRSLVGTVPNSESGEELEIRCSAKVSEGYTDGSLINHVVISAEKETGSGTVTASQFLYVNGGSPSGWPTEHGCFVQGPNGVYSHQGQQAVDVGSNWSTGFNISLKPVRSTIDGKVLRVCVDETYSASAGTGVCGGHDEGSYFGVAFGTYVILKENNTNLSAFYAHLSQPQSGLTEGASVSKGDVIGYVDNTGISEAPHLHYAFTKNSGASMNQPFIPYYVPTCSNTSPDPTCANAFASIGEPGRVCF